MKTTKKIIENVQKRIVAQSVAMIQKHVEKRPPCIAVLSVGEIGNLNWDLLDYYATMCNIHIKKAHCPKGSKVSEIMTFIMAFDKDESIDGIILNTPFDGMGNVIDEDFLGSLIVPDKDIVGQRYESLIRVSKNLTTKAFMPVIAESILNLVTENYGDDLKQILITVVGRDNQVSRPLINMLVNSNADVRWFHGASDPYAVGCDAADSDVIFTTKRMPKEFYESEANSSRRMLICWELNGQFQLLGQDREKIKKVVQQFIGPGNLEHVVFVMLMNHVAKAYTEHMRKEQG